ncbi:AIR synthase family protein [Haloferacaceae archaeon DSL9]
MIGKLDPETLAERVLTRTGAANPSVLTGAAYGEDAAAIDLGETILVVSADPISLAAERIGTLGIAVACNDVAASGGDPEWLTNVVFLPSDDPAVLDAVTEQLSDAAEDAGVTIVGGHSEYVPSLSRPLLSLTSFGTTDRYVPTGGAEPGDRIVLTKGAGIEGTAILASDFAEALWEQPDEVLDRATGFFDEISIVPEAKAVRDVATAMHDPTEGGVVSGLVELASASGVDLVVEREAIPVREETRALCESMGVDPLRIFGSGALLATVPAREIDGVREALDRAGVEAATIGVVEGSDGGESALVLDGERITDAGRDQLYPLWEEIE